MPAAWPWDPPRPRFLSFLPLSLSLSLPPPFAHEKRNDTSRTFDFLPRGGRGNNTEAAASELFEIVAADGKMG